MYRIVYTKQAVKDIKNLKSVHLDEKAKKLIEVIKENPFQNPPPYEELLGNLQGVYSRRINIQHRLVYQVYNEPIIAVISSSFIAVEAYGPCQISTLST